LGSRVPLHVVGAVAFASAFRVLYFGLKGAYIIAGLAKGKTHTPAGEFPLADGRRLNMRMLCENV